MSTTENSEQTAEQRSTPTTEAGCEGEINRGVQGTAHSADFAQFRQWLIQHRDEADDWFIAMEQNSKHEDIALELWTAFNRAIDELSRLTDAKDAS